MASLRVSRILSCLQRIRIRDSYEQVFASAFAGKEVPEMIVVQDLKSTVYDAQIRHAGSHFTPPV